MQKKVVAPVKIQSQQQKNKKKRKSIKIPAFMKAGCIVE